MKLAAVLCFVLCWTQGISSVAKRRQVSGQDDHSLQVMLENLAAQVEANNAKIEAIEAKLEKATTNIAFHAEFSTDPVHLGPGEHIIPDREVTNIGNCYNRSSGEFRVPLSGTYMFIVNFMGDKETSTYINLMVDDTTVDYSISHGDGLTWDHVSESIVLNLATGQRVWLRHGDQTRDLRGYHWTTFSGFLIRANP